MRGGLELEPAEDKDVAEIPVEYVHSYNYGELFGPRLCDGDEFRRWKGSLIAREQMFKPFEK